MYIRGAGLLPVYIQQGLQELSYHRKAIYTPLCIDSLRLHIWLIRFTRVSRETIFLLCSDTVVL